MGSSAAKHLCMAKLALRVIMLHAKSFRKGEPAQSKFGMNVLLLLAAQPSHSQTKHEFQIDNIVY